MEIFCILGWPESLFGFSFFFFFLRFLFIYLFDPYPPLYFIDLFLAVRGLAALAALALEGGGSSGRYAQASDCGAFSCCGAQALGAGLQQVQLRAHHWWLSGPGAQASAVVACRFSWLRSMWTLFLEQGSNPCPLHWQADSHHPLHHQGSPVQVFLYDVAKYVIFCNLFLSYILSTQINTILVLLFHFSLLFYRFY